MRLLTRSGRLLCGLALAALLAPALRAQPLVDGVTAGAALSMFQGDLDGNSANGPVEFISFGQLGAFVGVDRRFGPVVAEAVLQYDRMPLESRLVEMSVNMVSLDLTAGLAIDAIRPVFLRVYAGVAPALVMPSYSRLDERLAGHAAFEELGTRFAVTFPVGIVVQDVLRIGVRFTGTDAFDGYSGPSGNPDLITFVSLGYRFDLLR